MWGFISTYIWFICRSFSACSESTAASPGVLRLHSRAQWLIHKRTPFFAKSRRFMMFVEMVYKSTEGRHRLVHFQLARACVLKRRAMLLDKQIVCKDWILLSLHSAHAIHRQAKIQTHTHTRLIPSLKLQFPNVCSVWSTPDMQAEPFTVYIFGGMCIAGWVPADFQAAHYRFRREHRQVPRTYCKEDECSHVWLRIFRFIWQPRRALQFCWVTSRWTEKQQLSSVTSQSLLRTAAFCCIQKTSLHAAS